MSSSEFDQAWLSLCDNAPEPLSAKLKNIQTEEGRRLFLVDVLARLNGAWLRDGGAKEPLVQETLGAADDIAQINGFASAGDVLNDPILLATVCDCFSTIFVQQDPELFGMVDRHVSDALDNSTLRQTSALGFALTGAAIVAVLALVSAGYKIEIEDRNGDVVRRRKFEKTAVKIPWDKLRFFPFSGRGGSGGGDVY